MRLIDAEALFEALGLDQYNNSEGMTSTEEWIAEAITTAPTVARDIDVLSKRGRWLTEYGDHIHAGLRPMFICCSECGMVTAVEWHYCPNCGAKMEEQE